MRKWKKWIRFMWITCMLVCIVFYVCNAHWLTPEVIADLLLKHQKWVLIIYIVVCSLRGLTLVPATPFLLTGLLLFPHQPVLLWTAFSISNFITSTLIYNLSKKAELGDYFKKSYPQKIQALAKKLAGPYGFYFTALWAVIPFTPTDLICYVAGSIGVTFSRFIVPLMIGEGVVCAFYIAVAHKLFT